MNSQVSSEESNRTKTEIIENAVSRGVARYIASRVDRIPGFVKQHYSLRGALRIHRHAFGWDLVRVPLNILWSVVKFILAGLGLLAKVTGLKRVAAYIKRIPPGFETAMDRQIKWLVITELLELPYVDGSRKSDNDALMAEIMKDPDLEDLIDDELDHINGAQDETAFRKNIERKLAEYGTTRTGTADLASNVMVIISSKLALGQVAFGALSAGSAVAAYLAHYMAVSNFWLGPTIGAYFYAFFPVDVSLHFLIAVTAAIIIILAFVSTFIGILTDPLQALFGLHQKRLKKLINAIRRDLEQDGEGAFHLRGKYVGRIFDIVDFLAVLGRSA